jgi:acyl carrier protein
MDSETTRVIKKIAQLVRRPVEDVREDRQLRELVQDSFMLVEIVVDLEEELGVHLSHEDFAKIVTVRDLLNLIAGQMTIKAS